MTEAAKLCVAELNVRKYLRRKRGRKEWSYEYDSVL